jgi:phosphatidate cytidylyltransferase
VTATASERVPPSPELARRVVSGLILAFIVFASIYTVPTFTFVVLVVALLSLWELAGLSARKGQELVFPIAAVAVAAYVVLAGFGLLRRYEAPLVAGTLIASLALSLYGSRQGYFARSAYTLLGVLYIGKLASYFVALRTLPGVGTVYVVASIVLIALTDISAMLVGTTIGRTPLSSISPRKTWEGAIGAFLVASAAGTSLAVVPGLHIPWWHGLLIGAVTSFAAQAGDLVESALKRDARVKDAGSLLGGHGGVLDRFDSYTFGGVACYGALFLTGHIPPH